MLSDEITKDIHEQLEGPSFDAAVLAVVTFVEKYLIEFSNRFAGSTIINEKGLTQELCAILNHAAWREGYFFWFEKEFMEDPEKGNSPQVDIGVINHLEDEISIDSRYRGSRKSFFSMEAKRLGKMPKARECEYLVGRREKGKYLECGGVERFKNEIHGKGLKYAAIIGYVQAYDFDYWHKTINSRIDALIAGTIATSTTWNEKDKLLEEYKRSLTAKFKSENSRKTGSIILIHLWVNLVKITDGE